MSAFEYNLYASQKEEAESQNAYDESRQELIDAKMAELADTHERNAQTKHDVTDTKALKHDSEPNLIAVGSVVVENMGKIEVIIMLCIICLHLNNPSASQKEEAEIQKIEGRQG